MSRVPVRSRPLLGALLAAALVVGCTGDDRIQVEVATVAPGEVVQTVAASGSLQPAGEVVVTAPVGGEIEQLLVADGDQVAAGDHLVQLTSDSLDAQVEQTEAALEAADAFAVEAASLGVDVSPMLAGFRQQLDATFPPLIQTLSSQVAALEEAVGSARQAAEERLQDAESDLERLQAGLKQVQGEIDPVPELELDLDVDLAGVRAGITGSGGLQAALADARGRLAEVEAGYQQAANQLAASERQLRAQAEQASAAQQAAVQAQRDQAEASLEAARARIDDLRIVAPSAGVVELARPGQQAESPLGLDVPMLDLGEGLPGGVEGLMGSEPTTSSGKVEEGATVRAGQPLLTIYDLSSFTATVEVDEIDVVQVEVGQDVVVLLDAFPDAQLEGVVDRIALRPDRLPGGGATFPVSVQLTNVPDEVQLRIGLTASTEIEVRRVDAELVVPTSALLRREGGEVVHIVEDGVVREVPIMLQAMGDQAAAIVGDLEAGDEVVTIGVELVGDGAEVEVVG